VKTPILQPCLRPFQKQAIDILTENGQAHVLCQAPTGSGKSLIFETLARKSDSATLLISPLRALIRQQEQHLEALGVTIDSSLQAPAPVAWVTTPEQLMARVRAGFRPDRRTLFVVDECHCVEEWGPDFRTEFSALPGLPQKWELNKSLWLSATLTRSARLLLEESLPHPIHEIGSFSLHPHLTLQKIRIARHLRVSFLVKWLELHPQPGILFCASRKSCIELGNLLRSLKPDPSQSGIYHAGLMREERLAVESQARSGRLKWLSATSAFGMGMNYTHFEWVILWEPPYTLLSLAQMLGRCGRTENARPKGAILWDDPELERLKALDPANAEPMAKFMASQESAQDWLQTYFS
jgi:ATP-dependent DNA helicase RecQ